VIYFSFHNELNIEPAKGILWRLLRADRNEETVRIKKWLVEFDELENYTCREIGLDANNTVVYCSPSKMFYGYWADANMELESYERFSPEPISEEEFSNHWTEKFDE
jgi:hypothetical protein